MKKFIIRGLAGLGIVCTLYTGGVVLDRALNVNKKMANIINTQHQSINFLNAEVDKANKDVLQYERDLKNVINTLPAEYRNEIMKIYQ